MGNLSGQADALSPWESGLFGLFTLRDEMMQHEGACRFSTEVLRRMEPLCRWGVVILIVALGSPLTGADTPPRTANNAVAGEKPANAEGENAAEHPLAKAIGLAQSSRNSLKLVKDYTALFIK